MTIRLLFVCLGNICRSPTAEAVAKARLPSTLFDIDSAGTGAWHKGNPPDPRSRAAGEARGYSFAGQTARQVLPSDFFLFDHIIAMDRSNLADLQAMQPVESRAQLHLILDFSAEHVGQDVPDPYYGNDGFDQVITLIEAAMPGITAQLRPASAAE